MEFSDKYKILLDKIESRIANIVPNIEPTNLYEPFSYIMQAGGKRIRPVLTLIACGIVDGDIEQAIDSGVALEILHNFTLVHDDIMDNSLIRRNRPTVHKKWNESIAILVGDVMIGYAFKLLPRYNQHQRADEISRIFINELIEVCEGQVFDMDFNESKKVGLELYLNMIDKKTARMMESAAAIGGHIGMANESELNALRKISQLMGMAFQLQDDLLDMTAEQVKLGKKLGNDLLEGKKTYLIIKAKELAVDTRDIEFINHYYNNNGLVESDIPKMDQLFKKYGIYESTELSINQLFEELMTYFKYLRENEYKELLSQLINNIRNRNF